jgi:hypothetical protein
MLNKILFAVLLFSNTTVFCQDVLDTEGTPCPMEGNAKRANDQALNRLKNRYKFPQKSDFDATFNWAELAKFEDDTHKFDVKKAAILRGYVLRVRMSEQETCNCKSKNPDFRDTHITLTPSQDQKGVLDQVIIEVTPRMRFLMKQKGIDWSQDALKKLVGRTIEVEGWLFYDYKHGDQSAKVKQKTKGVTRSSAWEIHPVTQIKTL